MNLYTTYYPSKSREKELDFCLEKNLNNRFIKRVYVFNQSEKKLKHKKITEIKSPNRCPSYQDFFNLFTKHPDEVNIIANSDIFFDTTIGLASNISQDKCYALTRTEYYSDGSTKNFEEVHGNGCPAHFSQDVWIFRGESKLQGIEVTIALNNETKVYENVRFTIGIPGCDNVIAAHLKNAYEVKNPYNQIICHHYHEDQSRGRYTHRITGAKNKWGIIHQGKVPLTGL